LLSDVAASADLRKLFQDSKLIYLTKNAIFHNNANAKIALDNLLVHFSYGNN